MKRKRGELAEESSSSEEEQEDEEKEEMIEQQQNQKEKREFSSKPPPPPPPSKRMLGYVLEVLEKEDEDEDGGDETNEPVRILVLNCTEEDVKKSKHALCKCLVNNDGMRKHNISGVFFLSSDDGKENDAMLKNNNEAVIDIDSKNIFTIGGGDNSNEVGFRSSMRHLARLHCAVPSVFPLPESLTKTSCPPCEDNDSKRTTMTLGLCDEVAFYSNRNINGGEKNQHEISRGEDILNERTGDRKLPKLGLLDVFENLERFDSFKENARKAKHKIFSSDIGDEQKNTKEVEREKDEDEDELLPASFGKYPAHPKKGRAAPSSASGGPETIFLGTGCAEPSKYRAASAILLRDEEGIGASKSSILLDCGEGCLGAMRRYLGDDGCLNALKTLKMVWISHHHPDHCLGILAVLEARYKALRQQSAASSSPLTTPPPPLLIVGPTPIQKWFEIIDVPSFKYTFMKSSELQARGGIGGPFHISVMNKPGLSHPPPPPPLATKGNNSTFLQPKYPDVAAHVAKTINCQQVVAVPVTHCPEAFAIILRGLFTTKRSVAYSGDCRPSVELTRLAHGVDVNGGFYAKEPLSEAFVETRESFFGRQPVLSSRPPPTAARRPRPCVGARRRIGFKLLRAGAKIAPSFPYTMMQGDKVIEEGVSRSYWTRDCSPRDHDMLERARAAGGFLAFEAFIVEGAVLARLMERGEKLPEALVNVVAWGACLGLSLRVGREALERFKEGGGVAELRRGRDAGVALASAGVG